MATWAVMASDFGSLLCLLLVVLGQTVTAEFWSLRQLSEPSIAEDKAVAEGEARLLRILRSLSSSRPAESAVSGNSLPLVSADPADQAQANALLDCVNGKYSPKPVSWSSAMSDAPASVRILGLWWSSKVMSSPVTVVTQLSVDRMTQLRKQCESWNGRLSAVVYLALTQRATKRATDNFDAATLSAAVREFESIVLTIQTNPNSKCALDVILASERFVEERATALYPINTLRNLARLQARTPLIALLDVDMLVSSKLSGMQSLNLSQVVTNRTALVLPAFEVNGSATTVERAARIADHVARNAEKKHLLKFIAKGIVHQFNVKVFAKGHSVTNYSNWFSVEDPYSVRYQEFYEPWVVIDRKAAPWHDVRFRGYGKNKIVHIATMNMSDFDFVVHPGAFIIHRAHPHSRARQQYDQTKEVATWNTVFGHYRGLWNKIKKLMDTNRFTPKLDKQVETCLQQLSWWKK